MKTAHMNENGAIDLVCFGGEDWWYHNRGHIDMQLMRRFAGSGRVLYINSIMMRKVNIGEGGMFIKRVKRKFASVRRGLVEAESGFFVYSPLTFPVHHLPVASGLNQLGLRLQASRAARFLSLSRPVVWVACPAACSSALRLERRALVYQRTDRYEEYPGVDRRIIAGLDKRLKETADITFYVNRSLYDEEAPSCRCARLIDHGVDYDMFASAVESDRIPPEMQGITRPVVGFFGGIDDHTCDMPLLEEVAGLAPEMTFVLIGSASSDTTRIGRLSNVHLLGKRPYEQIPHYGKCFDVAIMPWRQNRWIEACNPIKLKEYLALGRPVVSTPFSELERYRSLVYVAGDPRGFTEAIRRAVREDDDARRRARREAVMHDTWQARAGEVLAALGEAGKGRDREPHTSVSRCRNS